MSASIMAANGPGPMPAISITFVPCSGPLMRATLSAEQPLRIVREDGVEGGAVEAGLLEVGLETGEEIVASLVQALVQSSQDRVGYLLHPFGKTEGHAR